MRGTAHSFERNPKKGYITIEDPAHRPEPDKTE